jgi:hypothetical protein
MQIIEGKIAVKRISQHSEESVTQFVRDCFESPDSGLIFSSIDVHRRITEFRRIVSESAQIENKLT